MGKQVIKLPGPLGDIAEALGSPADAANMLKKGARVVSEKMREASNDFAETDQIVKGIKIGKKRRR